MKVRRLPKLDANPEDEFKKEQREMLSVKKVQLKKPQRKR